MEESKYARTEDEQRFVVPAVPRGATGPRDIEDRYVLGTRLRVRTVHDGDRAIHKLGHKVPVSGASPSSVQHTSLYLDDEEFALLASLPAATLSKRRWHLTSGDVADEFLGNLEGLVLVEGQRPTAAPPGGVEVTDDVRFCGGSLAVLDRDDASSLVALALELVR